MAFYRDIAADCYRPVFQVDNVPGQGADFTMAHSCIYCEDPEVANLFRWVGVKQSSVFFTR